ncbi:MAG: MBL fold metallo-hydrolase, partial [Chloroflexota bacterium]|nr:MBL fold metallo-hydrolase [Chloroflexota bacterium]
MNYTLLRNAIAVLAIGGQRFLIDPMLDPKAARPPVANSPNQHPNPLVELPIGLEELVANVDALIVTHLHKDYFDDTAAVVMNHDLPLFGQPEDREWLQAAGFRAIQPVDPEATIGDIALTRTVGQHGTGEIGRQMAPVSGFAFDAPNESRVYQAGDTVWCSEVEDSIRTHQPEVI